jgi:hypothetical protein
MEQNNPIEEARRYVANAKEIIQNANYDPKLKIYTDNKYVKTAGNILWCGCLVAMDAVLEIPKDKGRPSIEKYKEAAGKRDKKLFAAIVGGYDTMHLYMGYDGTRGKKVCDAGFDFANTIINRCAKLYPKTACA